MGSENDKFRLLIVFSLAPSETLTLSKKQLITELSNDALTHSLPKSFAVTRKAHIR